MNNSNPITRSFQTYSSTTYRRSPHKPRVRLSPNAPQFLRDPDTRYGMKKTITKRTTINPVRSSTLATPRRLDFQQPENHSQEQLEKIQATVTPLIPEISSILSLLKSMQPEITKVNLERQTAVERAANLEQANLILEQSLLALRQENSSLKTGQKGQNPTANDINVPENNICDIVSNSMIPNSDLEAANKELRAVRFQRNILTIVTVSAVLFGIYRYCAQRR